jgi:hypothetical protein
MLTFVVHYRLPYKRMLVVTGVMLGFVLLVMVGEQVQEMQQANWISTTNLNIAMPDWLNTWFSIFPTVESLSAQALAAAIVIGSFYFARRTCRNHEVGVATMPQCIVPDCEGCDVPNAHLDDQTADNCQSLTLLTIERHAVEPRANHVL